MDLRVAGKVPAGSQNMGCVLDRQGSRQGKSIPWQGSLYTTFIQTGVNAYVYEEPKQVKRNINKNNPKENDLTRHFSEDTQMDKCMENRPQHKS